MYIKTVSGIFLVLLIVGMVSQGFLVLDVHAADTIIDTHGDSRFTKYPSGPYWYSRSDSGTYNNNFWYTYCGDAAHGGDLYMGMWAPSIIGEYEVFVWIPNPTTFAGYTPTHSANYQIWHSSGLTERVVNQALRLGGWYSLGSYTFASGSSIILNDRTGEPYISTMVAFDAIKFVGAEVINNPPYQPDNPSPYPHENGVLVSKDLSWTGGDPDGDAVTYDVYFGLSSSPPQVSSSQPATTYNLGTLSYATTYYWRITARDSHGASTPGLLWDFTTGPLPTQSDLTVEDIWVLPSSFYPSDTVTIYTRIKNIGSSAAVSDQGLWIKALFDSNPCYQDALEGLGSGYAYTFQWSYTWPSNTNSHTVQVTVDPSNYIVESSESNNILSRPFAADSPPINHAPFTPSNPSPFNHAPPPTVPITADLGWTGGDPDGDTVTYDVYFGLSSSPPLVSSGQSATAYNLGTLSYATTYYWKIVSRDEHGLSTIGPVWDFTTELASPEYKTLIVYSSPSGVWFTANGIDHITTWSGTFAKDTLVSLVMPSEYADGDARYYWDKWSDGVPSQSRTITLSLDTTVTGCYIGPCYELIVTSSPLSGIPFTVDGFSKTTPYSKWLYQGYYTIEMPATYNEYVWQHWHDGDLNRIRTVLLSTSTYLTAVYSTPSYQPPLVPAEVSQCKSDGVTLIVEGGTTSESTVVFKAMVADPSGYSVRLEIELRQVSEPFTGEPTPETISDFLPSGSQIIISRSGLWDGNYHWRYRAKNSKGVYSEWTEFGFPDNIDLAVYVGSDPHITSLSPPFGAVGIPMTIRGANFGPKEKLIAVFKNPVELWENYAEIVAANEEEVQVLVPEVFLPEGEEFADVWVEVQGDGLFDWTPSNKIQFVYRKPVIEALKPSLGGPESEVVIEGKHFGRVDLLYVGFDSKYWVRFGRSLAEVISWDDTRIVVKAPADFGSGKGDIDTVLTLLGIAIDPMKGGVLAVADKIFEWFKIPEALDLFSPEVAYAPDVDGMKIGVRVGTYVGISDSTFFTYEIFSSIYSGGWCPIEFRVYDQLGRVTGIVNGEQKSEIPYSHCYGNAVIIFNVVSTSFRYEVASQDSGTYNMTALLIAEQGNSTFLSTNIPITANAIHEYSIDWDALSRGEEGVIVLVDSDGIPGFEHEFTSDSELTRNEFLVQTGQSALYSYSIVWGEETFMVSMESNSTVGNFAFNQPGKAIGFDVSGSGDTIGFCNVTVPKALLYGEPWTVLIDGALVPPMMTEDSTYCCLYFTYAHSTHEVQIVGTWVIGPPPPPPTYGLTVTTTVGGTTDPTPGTYSYTANSMVQVTAIPEFAIPEVNILFEYWELDSVNVGSANPYTALMDKNHTLKAVFSLIPSPLSVSISPLSASIPVGQPVTFTSTVSGGYTPYTYQWYLNDTAVSGATSSSWTFTPTTSGIFCVYLDVIDFGGNTTQSEIAHITVAPVAIEKIYAVIDLDPHVLNLKNKGGWVTAYIELPQGYNVDDINVSTVVLNGTILIDLDVPATTGDYDGDGAADLMVRFNRTTVSNLILGQGIIAGNVTLTITGQLHDGTPFEGSAVIAVRMPGDLNMDGKVDLKDISLAARAFGSNPQNPRWNPVADENEDGIIDLKDIALVAKNFGKSYS